MKKYGAQLAIVTVLIGASSPFLAMDKPTESKGVFSRLKEAFSTKLTPEQATQKLQALINGDDKNITLKNIQPLIDLGADKEIKNAQGKTILVRAIEAGSLPVVGFLLENGANPKAGPLVALAVSRSEFDILKKLIGAGADVNSKDENGFTALYHAAIDAKPEVIELLLSFGANPNIGNKIGNTPLHAILQLPQGIVPDLPERQDAIITLLLKKGADATVANNQGKTPAMLARGTKYEAWLANPRAIKLDETGLLLLEEMKSKDKGKGRK